MITCLSCARLCDPNGKFCDACGRPLSAAKTPLPKRPPRPGFHFGESEIALIKLFTVFSVVALLIVLGVRLRLNIGSGAKHKSLFATRAVEAEAVTSSPESLRTRLLAYIAERNNSGVDFEEKLLGEARLEIYKPDEREAYFSLPASVPTGEAMTREISRFIADPSKIETAREEHGKLLIGNLSLDQRSDRAVLFRTSIENVKFDPDEKLSFNFSRGTYTVTLHEAVDYLTNRNAQGGKLQVMTGERKNGKVVVFANHGTYVARRGEPSLVRFVENLTRDIPASVTNARERKIQRLVDFVSDEITYDQDEASSQEEVLKHPVEILISQHGDCSNKAILLGSLLEQLPEDYLFLYSSDHITVAVPQGSFISTNGLKLTWEKQSWLIAEATVPGFRIGETRITFGTGRGLTVLGFRPPSEDGLFIQSLHYVQRPSRQNVIFDFRSGQPAEFR